MPITQAATRQVFGLASANYFPSSKPSLYLPFKQGVIDPRIVTARATTGMYWDAEGVLRTAQANQLRIDRDPYSGVCRGALIEPAATNGLLYSNTFSSTLSASNWFGDTASGGHVVLTQSAGTAPDGTANLWHWAADATANQHDILQYSTISATVGQAVYSTFVMPGEYSYFGMQFDNNYSPQIPKVYAQFNLSGAGSVSDLEVISGSPTNYSASIVRLGSNLYRCWITANLHVDLGDNSLRGITYITPNAAGNRAAATFTGDGTSGVYLFGQQIEAGYYPSSYIPTTSAAVTRAADVVSLPIGNWFNPNQGTFTAEFELPSAAAIATTTNRIFSCSDGTGFSANAISASASKSNGIVTADIYTASSSVYNNPFSGVAALADLTPDALSIAYQLNNTSSSRDGAGASTSTSVVIPSGLTNLYLGQDLAGNQLNGWLRSLAYYPQRLINAAHQQLSGTYIITPS